MVMKKKIYYIYEFIIIAFLIKKIITKHIYRKYACTLCLVLYKVPYKKVMKRKNYFRILSKLQAFIFSIEWFILK